MRPDVGKLELSTDRNEAGSPVQAQCPDARVAPHLSSAVRIGVPHAGVEHLRPVAVAALIFGGSHPTDPPPRPGPALASLGVDAADRNDRAIDDDADMRSERIMVSVVVHLGEALVWAEDTLAKGVGVGGGDARGGRVRRHLERVGTPTRLRL